MTSCQDHKLPGKHRAAHAIWAAIAIIASIIMIFSKQRGHPPIIAFVPLVWIFWVVGHFVIWFVHWLVARGKRITNESGGERKPLPIALWIALLGTGIPALIGIFQLLMTALGSRWYPFGYFELWGVMLAVWILHGVCFVGILLRRRWTRLLSSILAFGWSLLLASQIFEQLSPEISPYTDDLFLAIVLMVLLFLFGLYLIVSRTVKSFFSVQNE
jgi:hypothetical protein